MKVIGIISAMVISAMLHGVVVQQYWAWFFVPTFGLSAISMPVALGISGMGRLLTHSYDGNEDKDTSKGLIYSVAFSITALALGWVYTLFM